MYPNLLFCGPVKNVESRLLDLKRRFFSYYTNQNISVDFFFFKKNLAVLPTAFPECFAVPCEISHMVLELLIYRLIFSRAHGLLKGRPFFYLKKKKTRNKMFTFLFVQFVSTDVRKLFLDEDGSGC